MLSGFRVLDCTDERGFLAGKILGDLGADVIKLEPPQGDPTRLRGPFLHDQEGPERSLTWLALNTSKRGITLDIWQTEGQRLFRQLVREYDVLLESYGPGTLSSLGLGYPELSQADPRLVHCAITPFGQSGPYTEFSGCDLTVVAMGGNAAATGHPDRPPIRCSMPTSHYHAGPEAVLGVIMALYAREDTGRGQFVDVSLQECQLMTTLGASGQYTVTGRKPQRSGGHIGRTREIWRVKDGWVSFGLRGGPARIPNLRAAVEYMAECGMAPDWLRQYDWSSYDLRKISDDEIQRLEAAFAAFFGSRSMRELYEEALRRRILLAPCNGAREVLAHPQLRSRDFFVTLEYPELGASIEHPDFFARSSEHDLRIRSRAPRLGEHNLEVYRELGIGAAEVAALQKDGVV